MRPHSSAAAHGVFFLAHMAKRTAFISYNNNNNNISYNYHCQHGSHRMREKRRTNLPGVRSCLPASLEPAVDHATSPRLEVHQRLIKPVMRSNRCSLPPIH